MAPVEPLVKGLPEGVDMIDFQQAGPNDYELIRDEEGTHIYKGVRFGGAATGVRVKPATGYEFVHTGHEQIFDIREMVSKPNRPEFVASKVIEPQTITVTAKFTVTNAVELANLQEALKALPNVPGFVEMSRL